MHRVFTAAGKGNTGNQCSNFQESEQQREAHSAEELGARDTLERRLGSDKRGTQLRMSTASLRFRRPAFQVSACALKDRLEWMQGGSEDVFERSMEWCRGLNLKGSTVLFQMLWILGSCDLAGGNRSRAKPLKVPASLCFLVHADVNSSSPHSCSPDSAAPTHLPCHNGENPLKPGVQ